MKCLKSLTNVERAKLLYDLLPEEMPALYERIEVISKMVVDRAEELRATWSNPILSANEWIMLATDMQNQLKQHTGKLKTAKAYSEELFGGFLGMFSAHCVAQHASQTDNRKFQAAATLFFGYDPND